MGRDSDTGARLGPWLVSAAALGLALRPSVGINECAQHTTCTECLMQGAHPFCGWCSPSGILYANGSTGARCGDERDDPWDCPQHYQTKRCPSEYICNATSGQCRVTPPGTPGGTTNQSGCHAACQKAHKPHGGGNHSKHNTTKTFYVCQNDTSLCFLAPPGDNGTGTFTSKSTCNATCSKPHAHQTPYALLGLWRGVEISENFTVGEFDFLFGDGGVVNITYPGGSSESASCTSYIPNGQSDEPSQIWLTYTSGPNTGKVRKAIYTVGPPGPETNTSTIALGPPFPSAQMASPPSSFAVAMAGQTNSVFFLRSCLFNPGLQCQWKGAPNSARSAAAMITKKRTTSQVSKKAEEEEEEEQAVPKAKATRAGPRPGLRVGDGTDPCNVATNCSTCTAMMGGHECGWCTAPVQYGNGSLMKLANGDGVHCAGFSPDGSAEPWECSGLYLTWDMSLMIAPQYGLEKM
eukprot:SAG25_NODE_542_length_7058_cov_1.916942_10_plen_464_part_00